MGVKTDREGSERLMYFVMRCRHGEARRSRWAARFVIGARRGHIGNHELDVVSIVAA